jgi:uncharacterized Fe-S radical SAM superfamily protein PflX
LKRKLTGIDFIHSPAYSQIRLNINNECLLNAISICTHDLLKFLRNSFSNFILLLKNLIQYHPRYTCPYHIKDIGLDLLPRVLEFIESIICILAYHTILN